MQNITLASLSMVVGNRFFSVNGYVKADGTTSNFNAQLGVVARSKGGKWNGTPEKHILMHKPCHYRNALKVQQYNGYRTLKRESLIGCTIKANGREYKIVS